MRCLLRILEHLKSLLYVRLLPLTHRSVGYPVLCTVVPVVLTPVLLLIRPVFFMVSLSPFLRGSEDLFPVFLVVRSVLLPCCEIAHCIQVLPDVLHIACVPGSICHLCSFARHRKPCIIHSPYVLEWQVLDVVVSEGDVLVSLELDAAGESRCLSALDRQGFISIIRSLSTVTNK